MSIGEIGYLISKWIVYVFLWVCSIYGIYAVYYAYCKKKDERQRYIVLRSTAQAFCAALVLFVADYITERIVLYAEVKELTLLWDILHFDLEKGSTSIAAASTMMALLGICLFINKRRSGGD